MHLLFWNILSQQKRCPVDLWRWNRLVGLVVVGGESPMVKAVGVLLGILQTLREAMLVKEPVLWGLVKPRRGHCQTTTATPSPATGRGHWVG